MRIARFLLGDRVHWGVLEGEDLRSLRGDVFRDPRPGRALCSLAEARLLAPIGATNKVVAIAVNYGERDERDGPGIFLKQPGTVIGHLEPIVFPRIARTVIHEAELGIVIGRQARHVSEDEALDYVLGYTCANDVSARVIKNSDLGRGTSMRWKHFDTFCPLGPVITTGLDGDNLRIQCRVSGKTDVDFTTGGMLWGVAPLISWVSDVMALNPGDIISSGCPGVGEINVGDTVEVEIEGIGTLTNPVIADY
jgi:2-keto-4-pentenoate hydratase/2-oxohepta-3-ene-1,7-dioic acid hydratase in catechol pathway